MQKVLSKDPTNASKQLVNKKRMVIIQLVIYYFLHFVFPLGIVFLFFRKQWKMVSLVYQLTMLVDIDHLLSTPVFTAWHSCIGLYPLRSYPAMITY